MNAVQSTSEKSCLDTFCENHHTGGDGFTLTHISNTSDSNLIVFRKTCNTCGSFFDLEYQACFSSGMAEPTMKMRGISLSEDSLSFPKSGRVTL